MEQSPVLFLLKVRAFSQKTTHLLIARDVPRKLPLAMKQFQQFNSVQLCSATHILAHYDVIDTFWCLPLAVKSNYFLLFLLKLKPLAYLVF